jgi:hypothetical protein
VAKSGQFLNMKAHQIDNYSVAAYISTDLNDFEKAFEYLSEAKNLIQFNGDFITTKNVGSM